MPKLYVLSGPDVGKSFEVASGALVGRDPECTVRLRDPSVSRHHARVEHGDLGWSVVDTQSRNGLHVEGKRVPTAAMEDGAEFKLGEVLFRFRADLVGAPTAVRATDSEPTRTNDVSASASAASSFSSSVPVPTRDVPRQESEQRASVPEDEAEIVLEGDWEEPAPSSMAKTVITAPVELPFSGMGETSFAPRVSKPPVATRETIPARSVEVPASPRAETDATERRVGVAHRAGGTATSSRSVLQYQRVVDRPGFFNADLSQQPVWLKLALSLLALIVFAAVFWFAFKGTAFLKGKTQHEPGDIQAEENG